MGGLGFGFGSVWLRDLGMQLCFGFTSDVFAKLHIYFSLFIREAHMLAARAVTTPPLCFYAKSADT